MTMTDRDGVSLSSQARRLARAGADLDTDLVALIVQTSIDDIGVVSTWEQLVQPVWVYLGSRPEPEDGGVAVDELMYVQAAMRVFATARRGSAPPSVLLACADEEFQVLPLEALAGALEESGVPCCLLGARVPPNALAGAVARLRPVIVVTWSQTRSTADPAQIDALLAAHPGVTVLAAGPGWDNTDLPRQATRTTDLSTALVLILAAVEGHGRRLMSPGAVQRAE